MKFGCTSPNIADGILPPQLARELEVRGFESMWLGEHSHIPVSGESQYPSGGPLPPTYPHIMSPLISLATAAAATSRLKLVTGVCLVLEHDLLDLACQIGTLDVLSEGRLLLGVGAGWNREELANHRPDIPFARRFEAVAERIRALEVIWNDDVAEFQGTWDRFTPSWIYPKPLNGRVPITMGSFGKRAIEGTAKVSDEWCPIEELLTGPGRWASSALAIDHFRNSAAAAGRDPGSIPITICLRPIPDAGTFEYYAGLGVDRIVFLMPSGEMMGGDLTLRYLDKLAELISDWGGSSPPEGD